MAFHPTGDYLIVGSNQPVIRLYDTNTAQCFVCSFPTHYHSGSVTSLKLFIFFNSLFIIQQDLINMYRYFLQIFFRWQNVCFRLPRRCYKIMGWYFE